MFEGVLVVSVVSLLLIFVVVYKGQVIVPQQHVYVVERLGKYSRVLGSGFNVIVPFLERVVYRHSLKEQTLDIPEQVCITKDNVQVGIDGVIYLQVLDPKRASYGIDDYIYAISQLAQTTLRSEVGKIELDRTFEARSLINSSIVEEIDKASASWGVKILRYEIMNITPPKDVLAAMETQMRAEREKRARILESEGIRDSEINKAEGDKQKVIKSSEAKKQQQINEAQGQAEAMLTIAGASAESLEKTAQAISVDKGADAVSLRLAETYLTQFGNIAKSSNTLVVPANVADVSSMLAMALKVKDSLTAGRSSIPESLSSEVGVRMSSDYIRSGRNPDAEIINLSSEVELDEVDARGKRDSTGVNFSNVDFSGVAFSDVELQEPADGDGADVAVVTLSDVPRTVK